MKQLFWLTSVTLVAIAFSGAKEAVAISISATAVGSPNPTPLIGGGDLQNGDFLILENPVIPTLTTGDGDNETTRWHFDFIDKLSVDLFSSSAQLSAANITLTLTPNNLDISTDRTGIILFGDTLESLDVPSLPDVPSIGQTGTVSFDLLDFGFSQSAILNALNSSDSKSIEWFYFDDALVSFAQLDLTVKAVPEPFALMGVTTAMAVGGAVCMKRQRH